MSEANERATIPALLAWRADRSPDAAAFAEEVAPGQWRSVSWRSFAHQVEELRRGLLATGLRPGERLALVAPVSLRWELLHHAALALGAVVVGFDAHDQAQRIDSMCERAEVSCFALFGKSAVAAVGDARLRRGRLIVDIGGDLGFRHPAALRWPELLELGSRLDVPASPPAASDLATIIFTSGTTGEPKGIGYTHAQLSLALNAIAEAFHFVGEEGRLLCWLPLSNLFQRIVNLAALKNGPVTCLLDDPRRVMDVVARAEPDVFIAVPRFFEKLHEGLLARMAGSPAPLRWALQVAWALGRRVSDARQSGRVLPWPVRLAHAAADALVLARVRAIMGKRLRCMVSGSAPLSSTLLRELDALGWLVLEAYGLSENVIPMAMNRIDDHRFGSVGRPLRDNELKIEVDGAILVRGPGVFSGYIGEVSVPRAASDFHRTGDLGRMDEQGYLWLTGRSSELIKTSTGRRVSPLPAQDCLRRVPGVDQALVVGDGRKFLVALCTCPHPQTPSARAAIEQRCRASLVSLSAHERPLALGFIERPFDIASGEITANLKLRRQAIVQRHQALIDALYAHLDAVPTDSDGALLIVWPAAQLPDP